MTLREEKEFYQHHYNRFYKMPIQRLQQAVGELWEKRYTDYDTGCVNEHRIAARVYLERTRTGESLIYHLKNYIG